MIQHRLTLALIGISVFVACGQWPRQAAAQVNVDVGGVHVHVGDRPAPPTEVVEVLTRGPVHEAFAQPIDFDEETAFTIDRAPPAPIAEEPPDQRPEGKHIVWIPGYWSWDTDRSDFIWVSGCWRAVPPNSSWVPGYWARVSNGYQWVAGFWTTADAEEIEYLPAPPATLEDGPHGTATIADSIWVPGCWVRHDGRYEWRPGFWEEARANWVWVPAYYVSTPRGYVYVDGYWDRALDRRGVAFLPIYYPQGLYSRADYRYSPEYVLDLDVLRVNMFIAPGRHHYYFGDYYGPEYAKAGFHPRYEARDHHNWYDPIYVHDQWTHRDDHKWADNQLAEYEHRRDDKTLRPARTYEAMRTQVAHLPEKDRRQVQMARPMKEVVSDKATPYKFDALDAKTRETTARQAKDVHAYQDKRAQWESPAAAPREVVPSKETGRTPPKELPKQPAKEVAPREKPEGPDHGSVSKEQPAGRDTQAQKVKVPKSPVVVREPVTDKDQTPPPRPKQPNTDPNARPKGAKDVPDHSKDTDHTDKDNHADKDKAEPKRK